MYGTGIGAGIGIAGGASSVVVGALPHTGLNVLGATGLAVILIVAGLALVRAATIRRCR